MKFAPTIKVGGQTVTPKGYEWVLGFALGGCEWAIIEASKPEFLARVRADLEKETIAKLERLINKYENEIAKCRGDIDELNA